MEQSALCFCPIEWDVQAKSSHHGSSAAVRPLTFTAVLRLRLGSRKAAVIRLAASDSSVAPWQEQDKII